MNFLSGLSRIRALVGILIILAAAGAVMAAHANGAAGNLNNHYGQQGPTTLFSQLGGANSNGNPNSYGYTYGQAVSSQAQNASQNNNQGSAPPATVLPSPSTVNGNGGNVPQSVPPVPPQPVPDTPYPIDPMPCKTYMMASPACACEAYPATDMTSYPCNPCPKGGVEIMCAYPSTY